MQGRTGTYSSADLTLGVAGLIVGDSNKACRFNPATDLSQVNCNFNTDYLAGCTLEAIINPDATQLDTQAYILTKNQYFAGLVTSFPIGLSYQGSGNTLTFALSDGGDYVADLSLSHVITPAVNTHVMAVYRANGLCELVVNGAVVASSTIAFTISATTQNWRIGAATPNSGGVGNGRFTGVIDEAAIYGYALDSSRYLPHYQASQGIFPQTARAYASIF